MSLSKKIHLVADLSLIHTLGKWRYPGSWAGYAPYGNPQIYLDLARILEQGKFDGAFFADVAGTPLFEGKPEATVEWGVAWPRHDPLPMAIAMASVTRHLGFITTMSMTYHHPFNVARLYSSVDHVTGGRIAYNAVVSGFPQEAQNFGYDTTPDHEWRYRRAEEFQEVLDKLFRSVDPDAMLWDRETGRVADPAKVRRIDHEGEHFKVMGPLPCAPSPQGRPVQVQAGGSASGVKLAGRWADFQFAASGSTEGDRKVRADLDAAAIAAGRTPRDLGVLWARRFDVVSGPEEAAYNRQRFVDSIPKPLAIVFLSQWWGLDGYYLDPERTVHDTVAEVKALGVGPNWSYIDNAVAHTDLTTTVGDYARSRLNPDGGWVGTAEQIADLMEAEHETLGANGGFMIAPRVGVPQGFTRFVNEVVPELQRRGLYRTEYEGSTMRENMCLY
ncbi:NtaA/DmoA family FMN-dependent monooxygenase [Novosphingobium profundi]|uniref:NtaA/DmoA family FMN-dependent monooxygenase n=1 Tax=Novosphingobium profundi TaxID=1774954 RepID=UPI001BD953FB|nr:NtaA/DmoA family FMN-dependent monooxygenase [Novosphingobium profundi]MBT0671460.1 NtaA/DmoA family FMN-dependent monooxygenase [Novosphingobium profundi]